MMPVPNEKIIRIQRDGGGGSPGNATQSSSRTWSSTTKTYSSDPSNRSTGLFSNRAGGSSPSNNVAPPESMRSSSLVRNAMGDNVERRNSSSTTTYTSQQQLIPASTPQLSVVPSNGGAGAPGWSMGTDAQGDVPLTCEIVTKADGGREFQLLLTARNFSPEDLEVKLTENTLNISGKHEERSPNGAFSQKSFFRSCTIPPGVRPEDLNCSLDSCGRLKITAPVPPEEKHTTTKTITTTTNWHEAGVPIGHTIRPGAREQVVTVWKNNESNPRRGSNEQVTRTEERSTVVRSFKTVS